MPCNKTSLACQKPLQSAACVIYEPELPPISELDECSNSVEQVLTEHYTLIEDLRDNINMSNLGNNCIAYPLENITIKEILLTLETKFCELQTQYNTLLAQQEIMEQQIQNLQQNNCL